MKKPSLALFLELGGSFEEWNAVGFFSREISLYNKLARDFFGKIYIFTYGSTKDLSFADRLEKNIVIIPRGERSKNYLVNFLYELWMPFKFRKILKQCDIFKTNQNSGSIAASIAKILSSAKKLVIRSGYIGSELARRAKLPINIKIYYFIAEQLSYRLCDHAFIPTKENVEILTNKYPFLQKKVTPLNNFIDVELFKPAETKEKSKYDIIYVARFDRDKNHRAILEAAKDTNIRLLFIGKGPERSKIESLAKKYSIAMMVIESVPNDQLPRYYNMSKICVFPSLHEGNPKTLLEAMSCGLPIIALDSPGIRNIITDEKNGLIGPYESLRGNIFRLLSDSQLRDTLGHEARKTVIESYAFEKIAKKEIEAYKRLLKI